ncbi:MAG: stimulus-sensing domain-containing protein [Rhodospirillales bacterium]|jgi:two-component system sensor histidine kinase ChvG|nr:stimulus-sensing domain-containing protein [Rhodospirillales bacterium]HIJ44430.1 HAMP domain-containing protein [Rhodospirillaceae bacterium]MDP7099511.1 stimulus-sensing domain-containing protein [Rhodospirillales bacterium]HIJ45191.1 HAMP domain-containing protein [Rhodospirillaceae bacterium]HIJ93063.1 HAMP domain-containing protein [Rhodospirillaceae bacterium]
MKHPPGQPAISPITRRILAINVLALAILVGGLLYLGEYQRSLIAAELEALKVQALMFAAALGESAVDTGDANGADAGGGVSQRFVKNVVHRMVRRLAKSTGAGTRARLFDSGGVLIADSRLLLGRGGMVQIEELPPPDAGGGGILTTLLDIYGQLTQSLPGEDGAPIYHESARQKADDYQEVLTALAGEPGKAARQTGGGGMVLSVAVPVQRYKQVLGAMMLSKGGGDIDAALFEVRMDILKVFAVALAVTVLLSVYLSRTIARPLHRLAAAAERIRHGHNRQDVIPDFDGRADEIGNLAASLRDMTEALWQRMDAIECFAADVAHEIKNPLTSLQSAVDTAVRVKNAEQQHQLMSIIEEDVRRLDRLISDISDASRLDAELSRAEMGPVDLGRMLSTLVDVQETTAGRADKPLLRLDQRGDLKINGMERRLAQVFENIIANASSFTRPGGAISIKARAKDGWLEVTTDDDGPGIPEGKEEAIFERFYRDRPKGEKFGIHSGLGLSICKQIVETHGGTITAENRKDAAGNIIGARLTVRLPAG